MGVKMKFDFMNNLQHPTLILATRKGKKLGTIPAYNVVCRDCLNSYSEVSFKVNKFDNEVECRLWNQIKDFKLIYCKEWDLWFEIHIETRESNELVKTITGKTISEAELSQINLYGIEINTEIDISRDDYENPTVFYNPEYPEISLLDRLTEKTPHYTITHVDSTLMDIQRVFSFDGKSIYDAFQEIAEEIGCLFIFGSGTNDNGKIQRTIEVYDLNTTCNNCSYRGEFTQLCPECGSKDLNQGYGKDTKIFISSDNLADEIIYSTNADSVKNCFKVEGGDDLINATIRNCNPNGTDYIWHISDEVKSDMSEDLAKRISDYDELYRYYKEEHEINLDETPLEEYNSLVDKYIVFNEDLEKISAKIKGYPALMNAYYNTIDLAVFLQSALMPSEETSETSAADQADLLTRTNISPVAVTNLENLSEATAQNAVLAIARLLVKSNYQVKINDSSLSGNVWTGNFIVTNYRDEEDTANSRRISVEINSDVETYITQKIEKALHDNQTDSLSIVGLFELDHENFCNELKKYCLDSLLIFDGACQGALDILIEQGIAADKNSELYSALYKPYYNKSKAIQKEISIRESEVKSIIGTYDAYEDLIEYGIQNYIIDIRNTIQNILDFENYLGTENWLDFCAYRRDDKYTNSNYISDGLDNAELFKKTLELIEVANKEIYKSAELQHSISSSLKNLLSIEAFQPLVENFEVGNWIRLKVDENVYRLRLLVYEVDYDNLDNITVEFSDVLKISDGVSDVQSIIKQAASMATSYDAVAHQASQGSSSNRRMSEWVDKGLSLTNMKIVSSSKNQEITWDSHGFLMKEYFPVTDTFSDKQLKIINKGLYVTDDAWETSRAGIGNFIYYDPTDKKTKEGYGVIADTLIGNLILGENVGIYTSKNDITLNKDGFLITNESNLEISNPVTVKINPNDENGIFSIKSNDIGMILRVDADGRLIIGDSNFIVDTDGTATIQNIVMGGNITWDSSSNPIKVLYATTRLNKPTGSYSSYAPDSDSAWHTNYSSSDYYASYSYDGGTTWSEAIQVQGRDGEDGNDGNDAKVPNYIESTYIDFSKVESPSIQGNFILGGQVSGGSFTDADKTATLILSSNDGAADLSYISENGINRGITLFELYEDVNSVTMKLFGQEVCHASDEGITFSGGSSVAVFG